MAENFNGESAKARSSVRVQNLRYHFILSEKGKPTFLIEIFTEYIH